MLKRETIDKLTEANGELILAEMEFDAATTALETAQHELVESKRRLKTANRDVTLYRQVVESFERGGRHIIDIENHQENLRQYIIARGPVEYMKIDGISDETWMSLSEDSRVQAMETIQTQEDNKEQEILSGYRGSNGNYFLEYMHMNLDVRDAEAESIIAALEDSKQRKAKYDRSFLPQNDIPVEQIPEEETRITIFGKIKPVKRGKV